jgi:hypothetical protein
MIHQNFGHRSRVYTPFSRCWKLCFKKLTRRAEAIGRRPNFRVEDHISMRDYIAQLCALGLLKLNANGDIVLRCYLSNELYTCQGDTRHSPLISGQLLAPK